MKFNVRQAEESDLEAILAIYSQPAIDNGVVLNLAEAREIYRVIQSYPHYHIFVAEVENTVVGTIAVLLCIIWGISEKSRPFLRVLQYYRSGRARG
jgi:L-amino acid N-acyltransferase YncA